MLFSVLVSTLLTIQLFGFCVQGQSSSFLRPMSSTLGLEALLSEPSTGRKYIVTPITSHNRFARLTDQQEQTLFQTMLLNAMQPQGSGNYMGQFSHPQARMQGMSGAGNGGWMPSGMGMGMGMGGFGGGGLNGLAMAAVLPYFGKLLE